MNRSRLFTLGAALAVSLPAAAQLPSNDDLRMAGECSAIGYVVSQNRAAFPSTWQELALPLMMSPTVLAGSPDVPFKDNPVYLRAANNVLGAWRAAPNPGDFGKTYMDKTNACASWVGRLVLQKPAKP